MEKAEKPISIEAPEFPEEPVDIFRIFSIIEGKALKSTWYQSGKILGFPGTFPHPVASQAFEFFTRWNPNNILTHTRKEKSKKSKGGENIFGFIHSLERGVVYMLGNLLGSNDPVKEIDGYITSGGTEANIMGLWIARNRLLQERTEIKEENKIFERFKKERIVVLAPSTVHYSIGKACNLLGIGDIEINNEKGALKLIDIDNDGRVSVEKLKTEIDKLIKENVKKFIIVATAGTTSTGAFDPVEEIATLINDKQKDKNLMFHLHVDAAFGGLVAPFLEDESKKKYKIQPFGFDVKTVDTLTVDPHKMGFVPYPAGVFMCRKHLQCFVERKVSYITGEIDDTLIGSRPGASAAAIWVILKCMGRRGFKDTVQRCIKNTFYLEKKLKEIKGISIKSSNINIISVQFKDEYKELLEKTLEKLEESGFEVTREGERYRFVVMPHLGSQEIERFINSFKKIIKNVKV